MTTVALIRTTYVNVNLKRAEADPAPWVDGDVTQQIVNALQALWPELGLRTTGTVASATASGIYAMPGGIQRISRIDVEDTNTDIVDQVTRWRYYPDADPPTKIKLTPRIQAGFNLRFFGWKPFALDASDIPVRLESVVAFKATALAFGVLSGYLGNSQLQQGLDSGRVVDYQTAVGLSAYWERRYQDAILNDPARVGGALRASRR